MTASPVLNPSHARPKDQLRRIAAIDGLRGLAVALVIAFHFGAPLSGGFLGVDLFFVISGFVITRLLKHEIDREGKINLLAFLTRRARRLLPGLLVVLVALQIWLGLLGTEAMRRAGYGETVASAFYVSNWHAIFSQRSYWDIHSELTPLNHLWSLAVEEQFYLLWPVILLLGMQFMPRKYLVWAVGLLAGLSYLLAFLLSENVTRAYEGTDTRAGALLLGALLALLPVASGRRWSSKHSLLPSIIGTLSLAAFLGLAVFQDLEDSSLYAGGLVAAGVTEAGLIWSVSQQTWLSRFFQARPFLFLGKLSYTLYLLHWPIWVAMASIPGLSEGAKPVIALGLCFGLALPCYFFVESRIMRARWRGTAVALLIGLLVVAAYAGISIPPPQTF